MCIRYAATGLLALLPYIGHAQEPVDASQSPLALHELNRQGWPHIGSPPTEGGLSARATEWRQEALMFDRSFQAIKRSWTGDDVLSIGDLQFRVQQYEDLIKTIAGSAGYGNALLADCLRRLSLTLTIEYALAHPSENEAIAAMLKSGRIRLLDSPAVGTMLAEELNLVPPGESWHLSESREEIELVFRATGSTYAKENGRILLGLPSTSTLGNRRDVYGVLLRVLESDMLECVHLPGLIEFRKLGGRLEDLDPNDIRPYWRVMEHDMRRFQFPPFGINMLRPGHLGSLVQGFDPHGREINTFTRRALE